MSPGIIQGFIPTPTIKYYTPHVKSNPTKYPEKESNGSCVTDQTMSGLCLFFQLHFSYIMTATFPVFLSGTTRTDNALQVTGHFFIWNWYWVHFLTSREHNHTSRGSNPWPSDWKSSACSAHWYILQTNNKLQFVQNGSKTRDINLYLWQNQEVLDQCWP